MSRLLASIAMVLGSVAPLSAADWTELFNGRDLSGWSAPLHADSFQVVDGAIRAHCTSPEQRSHLFYVGDDPTTLTPFKNFELEVVARGEPGSNSGVFFHTDTSVRDAKMHLAKGYEAQLNSSEKEKRKTGSLYQIVDVEEAVVDDTQWFTLRIRVQAPRIQIFINDQQVVDYTEPANVERTAQRAGRLLDPNGGAIALQAHDPGSVFYFRSIRVRKLE